MRSSDVLQTSIADGDPLLGPEAMAKYMSCSERYARELMYTGAIPSIKVGRLRRARRSSVDAYIRQLGEEQSGGAA